LKIALSIDGIAAPSFNATIPQMIAMLHHKTEIIENIESTPCTEQDGRELAVRMVEGPELSGHSNNNPRITVFAPSKGKWVDEKISWK
jgi:hypothetical protein